MSGTNPSDPAPQNAIWSAPEPQAVLGLNSSMTYGSQFQCASPVNFQIALGANYQLLVDPVGLAKAFPGLSFPDALDPLFGGGEYGNLQLTLGTSVQLTMGKSYTIDLGPDHAQTNTDATTLFKPMQKIVCLVIALATIIYTPSYGLASDDDSRAILTMVYQALMQLSVDLLMMCENANQTGYNNVWRLLDHALFQTSVPNNQVEYLVLALAELAVAAAVIVPPIMDSIGEKQLDDAKAQQAH